MARIDTARGSADPATDEAVPAAIELIDVSKEFVLDDGSHIQALDHVDLLVKEGEFCCVLGPSGHGKSTTLNMVAGFLTPTRGSVLSYGLPVDGPGPDRGNRDEAEEDHQTRLRYSRRSEPGHQERQHDEHRDRA